MNMDDQRLAGSGLWRRTRFARSRLVAAQLPLENPGLAEPANVMRCFLEILPGDAGDDFFFLIERQGTETKRHAVGPG